MSHNAITVKNTIIFLDLAQIKIRHLLVQNVQVLTKPKDVMRTMNASVSIASEQERTNLTTSRLIPGARL